MPPWIILCLFLASGVFSQPKIYTDASGNIRVTPYPVEVKWLNPPYSTEEENGFWERANNAIRFYAGKGYGNTFQENEKRFYPFAFMDYLAGNKIKAVAALQEKDNQADTDHKHTEGIDFYWCFTLKGQVRKYWLWGKHFGALDAAYMAQMKKGATTWTQKDPLEQVHPLYGTGDPTLEGWGPERFGIWVDGRNTDNLRAMREVSAYLFAEETGNEATRLIYKERIKYFVWVLYNIGQGEWDSETYHVHGISTLTNLYDFAKDPEVKELAKDALDWLYAAAALKYWHGAFGGPNKRDYGGANVVFGASSAHALSIVFGDIPYSDPNPYYDDVYVFTTAYRPPKAVVALARKDFPRPAEMINAKPTYEHWKPGASNAPETWETLYFGKTFYLGSCVSKGANDDVGPFKLLAENSKRGVDYFVGWDGAIPNTKRAKDQMAQYRNLFIWQRAADTAQFHFQLPKTAVAEIENGIWFYSLENTYLAVRPIGLGSYEKRDYLKEGKPWDLYKDEWVYSAASLPGGVNGFALEVGEAPQHPSYAAFKEAVLKNGAFQVDRIKGKAVLTGSDGKILEMDYNTVHDIPTVIGDGQIRDYEATKDVYRGIGSAGPLTEGWKQGNLKVTAGGTTFSSSFSPSLNPLSAVALQNDLSRKVFNTPDRPLRNTHHNGREESIKLSIWDPHKINRPLGMVGANGRRH